MRKNRKIISNDGPLLAAENVTETDDQNGSDLFREWVPIKYGYIGSCWAYWWMTYHVNFFNDYFQVISVFIRLFARETVGTTSPNSSSMINSIMHPPIFLAGSTLPFFHPCSHHQTNHNNHASIIAYRNTKELQSSEFWYERHHDL